jgi:hypothetical protein
MACAVDGDERLHAGDLDRTAARRLGIRRVAGDLQQP